MKYLEMFSLKHKVMPISDFEMKYHELLNKIRTGEKMKRDDWEFIHNLPHTHLITILKMYNLGVTDQIYISFPTTLSTN
jgi:hypothetical protein